MASHTTRLSLEDTLKRRELDFTGAYLALRSLRDLVETQPASADGNTLLSLEHVLRNPSYASQTQSFFLYREAAETMVSVMAGHADAGVGAQAFEVLRKALSATEGAQQRATTEALGSLPLHVRGPKLNETSVKQPLEGAPGLSWKDILKRADLSDNGAPVMIGRNLVIAPQGQDHALVVKTAKGKQAGEAICVETDWMRHLGSQEYTFPMRFDVPIPLTIDDHTVFRIENLPAAMPSVTNSPSDTWAVAFFASKDYFTYPNDHRLEKRLGEETFKEVLCRNAWLLGKLASHGIVHCAPIPLFHNRVQRARRNDGGLYEWQRGGRLDRWLYSCRFPNFGLSGLRDFEHFRSFEGTGKQLYSYVGTHLLSLYLTAGSYFRYKDASRVGFKVDGTPTDTRDLFDAPFLEDILHGIFLSYYSGFTGDSYTGEPPCNFGALAARMIEEMGVDRHMEEILRVADQTEMSNLSFKAFLKERGIPPGQVETYQREEKDIVVHTGPHLGGFNERISVPELIDSLGAMSALCIAGRFLVTR